MARPAAAEAADLLRRIHAVADGTSRNRIGGPGVSPTQDLIRTTELAAAHATVRPASPSADSADGGIGTLVGYAAVFGSETTIDSSFEGRFREVIAPGAFDRTLRERGNRIKVQYNHGMDPQIGTKPLGVPAVLRPDATGLWSEVPLDATSYNADLIASLRSGAIDGMSFRFSVHANGDRWEPGKGDALPLRTLLDLDLYEFGPVDFPAYLATTAGIRDRRAFLGWLDKRVGGGGTPPGRALYATVGLPGNKPSNKARAQAIASARRIAS